MVSQAQRTSTVWTLDKAHSAVDFSVKHMMISNVRGTFKKFDVAVDFSEDSPQDGNVDVSIDASSIETQEERRDNHLRSADFFEVEKYPRITFVSNHIEPKGKDRYDVFGQLTIKGISLPVTLDTEISGYGKDHTGHRKVGINAKTEINRKDFGLNWNMALEAGGVLVGDRIKISIEAELVKQGE